MPFNRSLRPEERGEAAKRSPADTGAARHFYSPAQSQAYTSAANAAIQRDLTRHALELLQLRSGDGDAKSTGAGGRCGEVLMLLDVGAGSGMSTAAACAWLQEQQLDAVAVALDISAPMLALAATESAPAPARAEFVCADAGQRLPLRAGQFHAAIGISMLQWLPRSGLEACFASLRELLAASDRARAVFQVYPPSAEFVTDMERVARRAGFGRAEAFVSFPHATTAKKWFFGVERAFSGAPRSPRSDQVCVFGRRFHRRCALQWLDDVCDRAQPAAAGVAAIRARLEREHVREAWHVLRKFRRASSERVARDSGAPMHAQARRSLELYESDKRIGQALTERFKVAACVDYALLLANAREVVSIVHAEYTSGSKGGHSHSHSHFHSRTLADEDA